MGDSPPVLRARHACCSALNPYRQKQHLEEYSPYEIQSRNNAVRLNEQIKSQLRNAASPSPQCVVPTSA